MKSKLKPSEQGLETSKKDIFLTNFAENPQKPDLNGEKQTNEPVNSPETENKDLETDLRIKALESFIFTQVNEIS